MRRLSVVVVAVAAAVATAAVIAASGSAQSTGATSLHFITKGQSKVGFGPNHKPRQGDRFGFGDTYTGGDKGYDRGACTVVGTQALCTVVVHIANGTLTAQGLSPTNGNAKNLPYAITGGTGAYDGARGTALVTDTSHNSQDIKVTLKP